MKIKETHLSENVKIAASQFIEEKKYWKKKLSGEPEKNYFYYDYPDTNLNKPNPAEEPVKCSRELFSRLNALSKGSDPKLHMILTTALAALLAKNTGNLDIMVGTTIDKQDTDTSGELVNTILPLRMQLNTNTSFKELLLQVKDTINEAIENQNYPIETLGFTLFDAALVLENIQDSKYLDCIENNLTFSFIRSNETLEGIVHYNGGRYKRDTVQRIIRHFLRLLEITMADVNIKIADIDLLLPEERKRLMEFNNTRTVYPRDKTIHQLFAEQAEKNPDSTAVIGPTHNAKAHHTPYAFLHTLTYRELNEKSSQLACLLKEKGVQPGTIVSIIMEHSLEVIIGLLGILKAGAAFLPIDPGLPRERIDYMLTDSKTQVLVVDDSRWASLLSFVPKTLINLSEEHHLKLPASQPPNFPASPPSSLAYIIYTSGSTGRPKGVMVEHRGLVNYACWAAKQYIKKQTDRFAFYTAIAFDLTITSIFAPLVTGSIIVVYRGEEREFLIERIMKENAVELMKVTPTHLKLIRTGFTNIPFNIKTFIVGGEQLETHLARDIYNSFNEKIEIYNEYGPTEAVVGCMIYRFEPRKDKGIAVPIGKPADNVEIYLLDKNQGPVPTGVPGEIYISGHGVARGYLNQPELTTEKFDHDFWDYRDDQDAENNKKFFQGGPGGAVFSKNAPPGRRRQRIYKTGDLARWLKDGNIEFLGRSDHQVKIKGYRIEPAEIETRLLTHPGVKEAVVLARGDMDDTGEHIYLCAYIIPTQEGVLELREYLSQSLPDFMVPSFFVQLEQLPLTSNGKLDRKSLPGPVDSIDTGVEYREPRTNIEEIMVEVWQDILGVEKVGIDDGYFTMGGDSVKAIQIAASLQQHQLKMEIADLFQYPTIGELSSFVSPMKLRVPQEPVHGQVPLTPIQHWFFEKDPAKTHPFNMSVMLFRPEGFKKDILEKVFTRLTQHHDALRMSYEIHHNESVVQFNQKITNPFKDLQVLDLEEQANGQQVITAKSDLIQRSVDITTGDSLFKLGLFRTPRGDYLLITVHHLVFDGVSWRILFEDFKTLYKGLEQGEEPELPLKTTSFKEWSEKLHHYANSKKFLEELPYWEKIEQMPYTPLPKNKTPQKNIHNQPQYHSETLVLTREYTEKLLKEVNRAYNTEINDILLTALGLALKEWTGIETALVSLEGHGREEILENVDITRTIGWFTSVYPIALDVRKANDLSALIKNTKEMLRRIPSKGIGYGLLRYLTTPENKRNLAFKLAPQIGFNYLGQFDEDVNTGFYQVANIPPGNPINPEYERDHSLEIGGMVANHVLKINITYNKQEFNKEKVLELADKYRDSLVWIIDFCVSREESELTVSDLTSADFSEEEMESIMDELEDTFGD